MRAWLASAASLDDAGGDRTASSCCMYCYKADPVSWQWQRVVYTRMGWMTPRSRPLTAVASNLCICWYNTMLLHALQAGSGDGSDTRARLADAASLDDAGTDPNGKKQRLVWTPQLHSKFVDAYASLGSEKAVPKAILTVRPAPRSACSGIGNEALVTWAWLRQSRRGRANLSALWQLGSSGRRSWAQRRCAQGHFRGAPALGCCLALELSTLLKQLNRWC
jgi:hypothetical protein